MKGCCKSGSGKGAPTSLVWGIGMRCSARLAACPTAPAPPPPRISPPLPSPCSPSPPRLPQGLFHPARKVREVYWRLYNNVYIGAQVAWEICCGVGGWVLHFGWGACTRGCATTCTSARRWAGGCDDSASQSSGRRRACVLCALNAPMHCSIASPTRRLRLPVPLVPPMQDSLVACYPRFEDDGINSFRRHEMDVFI